MSASLEVVADWMAELFEQRTLAIAEGRTKRLTPDMYEPGSRVVYSEVRANFPGVGGPDDRNALQPLFEAALRRRRLLGVLKGVKTVDHWYAHRRPNLGKRHVPT